MFYCNSVTSETPAETVPSTCARGKDLQLKKRKKQKLQVKKLLCHIANAKMFCMA